MSTITNRSLPDRYAGTLLGLACGDALGGPVEFLKRNVIAARFPTGVTEFIGGGWLLERTRRQRAAGRQETNITGNLSTLEEIQ